VYHRPDEGLRSGTRVTDGCELRIKLGPTWPMPLTSEPSLQPLNRFFFFFPQMDLQWLKIVLFKPRTQLVTWSKG
jgi:hypothetical protein